MKMSKLLHTELQALYLKGQMQNVQSLETIPDLIAELYIYMQEIEMRLQALEPKDE